MRADEAVREQVQAQVGVVRVGGRGAEVLDHGRDRDDAHAAARVLADRRRQLGRAQRRGLGAVEHARADRVARSALGAERDRRIPGVQHAVAVGQRGQAHAPRAALLPVAAHRLTTYKPSSPQAGNQALGVGLVRAVSLTENAGQLGFLDADPPQQRRQGQGDTDDEGKPVSGGEAEAGHDQQQARVPRDGGPTGTGRCAITACWGSTSTVVRNERPSAAIAHTRTARPSHVTTSPAARCGPARRGPTARDATAAASRKAAPIAIAIQTRVALSRAVPPLPWRRSRIRRPSSSTAQPASVSCSARLRAHPGRRARRPSARSAGRGTPAAPSR